jgi:hypothetical protein
MSPFVMVRCETGVPRLMIPVSYMNIGMLFVLNLGGAIMPLNGIPLA